MQSSAEFHLAKKVLAIDICWLRCAGQTFGGIFYIVWRNSEKSGITESGLQGWFM